VLFINGEYWVILDLLRAEELHRYDLLFHLAPPAQDAVSLSVSNDTLTIHSPQLVLAHPLVPTVLPSIEEGFVSTSYGKKEQAPIIRLTQHATSTCFLTVIYPYKIDPPKIAIDASQITDIVRHQADNHEAPMHVTITHSHGQRYCDELIFINHCAKRDDSRMSSHISHVRVSRTNDNDRLLFWYKA
jgi:hypothetical protein